MVEQIAEDYPDRFAALSMHVNGDGFDTPWGQDRLDSFYGIPGAVPTFMVDALWNCQSPGDYRYYVEQQLASPTDMTLELSGSPVGGATWDITARLCHEGSGSRPIRLFTAAALDGYPNPPRHSTNVLRQNAFETDLAIAGGACETVTTRITFDPESMAATSDIVIIAWAQKPAATAPTTVYQAAVMRWPFPAGSQLTTIEIEPADATVAVGGTVGFTAQGKDQHGAEYPLVNPVWSLGTGSGGGTFDPGTGTTTTFTATAVGTRQLLCSEGGVTGGAIVTITAAPRLATIEIEPADASVAVGGTVAFTATGRDQYGDEFPLGAPVWTIDGDGDGTFEPATGAATTFTASYPGSATVRCTDGAVVGSTGLEITGDAPRLATITVSPASATIRVGDSLALSATGTDQYGRAIALADPVWRVEGVGAGTLEPAGGSAATTFTATAVGSVSVICSDDGVEGSAAVTITAAGLPAPRKVTRRVAP
ncbi:MAG: hypothetical protein MUC56_14380 [Thermoanaerobaculales bacterium]|nr:hypothetical protein [Thermoanaerobaculales bacterium]